MRVVTRLLQILAICVLALGAFLLAIDPRLRDLAVQDLSLLIGGEKLGEGRSPADQGSSQSSKAGGGSPTITESGYTIAPGCALWSVEGLDLYYSPADPATVCVQPPGSPIEAGSSATPGATQLPPNCAVAPDLVVYCLVGGQLSADTLRALYDWGELQTPREPGGGGG